MNISIIINIIIIFVLIIMLCMEGKNKNNSIYGGYFKKDINKSNIITLSENEWNNPFTPEVMKRIKYYTNNISTDVPIKTKDIKYTMPYTEKSGFVRNTCHKGQRKLFLTELQALSLYPEVEYVIYVGSAPSRKSYIYHHLFPNTKFIYVDPVEFNIEVGTINDFLYKPFRPITDVTTMYDSKDTKIIWLYDNYVMEDGKGVYDIVAVKRKTLDRGNHMYEIYDINKKKATYVDRFNKDMKKWKKTIYDIEDDESSIEGYRKIITNSSYRFFLIQGFMTISLSSILNKILKGKKVAFWSDIRTSIHRPETPTDVDIVWNTCQCHNWISNLKPHYYMLKFRIPFYNMPDFEKAIIERKDIINNDIEYGKNNYNIDFIENYRNKKFEWLKGDIYIQCYAPVTSTECRLIGEYDENDTTEVFDMNLHENRMFFFNNIQREFAYYKNSYLTKDFYMNSNVDCMMEIGIWEEYKKIYKDFDIRKGISILNKVAGDCKKSQRQTWENYRKFMIERYPWMKNKILQ